MTGEKRVSRDGLNNIFNAAKKLSREAAAKKYHNLSPGAREEADVWINRAFYLETGLKPGTKLDSKNPEHSEYIEKWLNHRDRVMGWSRNWEKPSGNLETRIFRDDTPTSPEDLVRSEGIFEQRMTGGEFKKHVQARILEAEIYNPSELRKTQKSIALSLTSKLFENEIWLKNATATREGRDALRILKDNFLMSTYELQGLSAEEHRVYNRLSQLMKPYDVEIAEEKRVNVTVNREAFKQVFPKLSENVKTKLESQGYEVDKVYYNQFLNHVYEIRAETVKKVQVNLGTMGYRGDPYVSNVRTEREDICIGGVNLETGEFMGASFFNKHGTAETDWDTQLAIGEVAVLAGVGVRAVASGLRSIIMKVGERSSVKVGETLAEKQMRDTVQDLGETLRVAKSTLKDSDNTLQDLGATIRGVQIENSDTLQDLGSTMRPTRTSDTVQDVGSTLRGERLSQKATSDYFNESTRNWIGDDVINSATDIGMNQASLGEYFEHLSMQVVKYSQRDMFIGEGPELIKRTALEQIQKAVTTLGRDRARSLIDYGMDPMDISNHIDDLVARGFTGQMIRENVSNEIKLMDHLKDHFLDGSQESARAAMRVNGRSAKMAIKSEIQDGLMKQYKLDNPNYHELPSETLAKKWLEQSEEADSLARKLGKKVLGSSSAGVVIYKRPHKENKKKEPKPLKIKEKKDNRETQKRIREQKNQFNSHRL